MLDVSLVEVLGRVSSNYNDCSALKLFIWRWRICSFKKGVNYVNIRALSNSYAVLNARDGSVTKVFDTSIGCARKV